jgi:hypothetical protein
MCIGGVEKRKVIAATYSELGKSIRERGKLFMTLVPAADYVEIRASAGKPVSS